MKRKIKISGKPNLLWVIALSLILVTGIFLVKEANAYMDAAVTVFASGGEYVSPNSSFADLMR